MSILVDSNTRLIVQGITGRMGRTHAALMRAYGTNIVGGTSGRTDIKEAAAKETATYPDDLKRTIGWERKVSIGFHLSVAAFFWYQFGGAAAFRAHLFPVFFVFPIAFTLNRLGQHYDIDPRVYAAMLDPQMTYSCGYWRHADDLATAQELLPYLAATRNRTLGEWEKMMDSEDVQVCGRGPIRLTYRQGKRLGLEKVALDAEYLARASFLFDLKILLGTVAPVVLGKGVRA